MTESKHQLPLGFQIIKFYGGFLPIIDYGGKRARVPEGGKVLYKGEIEEAPNSFGFQARCWALYTHTEKLTRNKGEFDPEKLERELRGASKTLLDKFAHLQKPQPI